MSASSGDIRSSQTLAAVESPDSEQKTRKDGEEEQEEATTERQTEKSESASEEKKHTERREGEEHGGTHSVAASDAIEIHPTHRSATSKGATQSNLHDAAPAPEAAVVRLPSAALVPRSAPTAAPVGPLPTSVPTIGSSSQLPSSQPSKRAKIGLFMGSLKQKWTDFKAKRQAGKAGGADPISIHAATAAVSKPNQRVQNALSELEAAAGEMIPTESPDWPTSPSVSPPVSSPASGRPSVAATPAQSPAAVHSAQSTRTGRPPVSSRILFPDSLLEDSNDAASEAALELFQESPPALSELHAPLTSPHSAPEHATSTATAAGTLVDTTMGDTPIVSAPDQPKLSAKDLERLAKEAREAERAREKARKEELAREKAAAKEKAKQQKLDEKKAAEAKKQAFQREQESQKLMKLMLQRAAQKQQSGARDWDTERQRGKEFASVDDFHVMSEERPEASPGAPLKLSPTKRDRALNKEPHAVELLTFSARPAPECDDDEFGSRFTRSVSDPQAPLLSPSSAASPSDSISSSSSSSFSSILGWLDVHILGGRHVNGRDDAALKQKTMVEVAYAGNTYKSEFCPGSAPAYDFKLLLPVHEICTDIVIRIILKHALKKNEAIAMAVVPIPLLLKGKSLVKQNGAANILSANTIPLVRTNSPSASTNISPTLPSSSAPPFPNAAPITIPAAALSKPVSPTPPSPLSNTTHNAELETVVPFVSPVEKLKRMALALFSPARTFPFRHWLKLYPCNYDSAGTLWRNRFPAAEDGIMASGMAAPKKELGYVHVDLRLRLQSHASIARAYLESNPKKYFGSQEKEEEKEAAAAIAAANNQIESTTANEQTDVNSPPAIRASAALFLSPPPASSGLMLPPGLSSLPSKVICPPSLAPPVLHQPEQPVEFNKTVFKKNVRRLRRLLARPLWVPAFMSIFDWSVPILTFYFLALWIYACFAMPVWQYPLALVLSVLALNIWRKKFKPGLGVEGDASGFGSASKAALAGGHRKAVIDEYTYIHVYQEDALPYEHAGEGHWRKFQRYKGHVAKISGYIGKIASQLEKTNNLLNFTEMHLSIFAYSVLLSLAGIASAILFFIPLRVCVFLAGLSLFIKGGQKTVGEYLESKRNEPKWWLHSVFYYDASTSISLPAPKPSGPKQIEIPLSPKSPSAPFLAPSRATSTSPALSEETPKEANSDVTKTRKFRIKAWIKFIISNGKVAAKLSVRGAKSFLKLIKTLVRMLKYLHYRSPDAFELAHRVLCERAIEDSDAASTAHIVAAPLATSGGTLAPTAANAGRALLFGTSAASPAPTHVVMPSVQAPKGGSATPSPSPQPPAVLSALAAVVMSQPVAKRTASFTASLAPALKGIAGSLNIRGKPKRPPTVVATAAAAPQAAAKEIAVATAKQEAEREESSTLSTFSSLSRLSHAATGGAGFASEQVLSSAASTPQHGRNSAISPPQVSHTVQSRPSVSQSQKSELRSRAASTENSRAQLSVQQPQYRNVEDSASEPDSEEQQDETDAAISRAAKESANEPELRHRKQQPQSESSGNEG